MRRTNFSVVILCVLALVSVGMGAYAEKRLPKPSAVHPSARHAMLPKVGVAPPIKPYAFPGGGRNLQDKYRFVALYGSPDSPALGALGEQPAPVAAERITAIAHDYQPYSTLPMYPTFEIITTIASASPTEDGDYSRALDVSVVRPWIEAAQAAGVYVVLDLQPGRSDFLTQAKQYEALLKEPNVGLALDPEWRLTPDQLPLHQIGSVDIAEVNGVIGWLSTLTRDNRLPQKLFVLHEFRLDMLPNRDQLDTAHPELAYMIQMDGQGGQPQKQDTWSAVTANPPANVTFGWKNFYLKDSPMLDIAGTMAITPQPWYISYQ